MANANLFQQYLQPARSVEDYANDMDLADARRADLQTRQQQNALQSLQLRQSTQQMADADQDRNALQRLNWGPDTTADQRISSLRNTGRPGLLAQADALEKALIERQKGSAAAAKDTAEADKIKLATDYMKRDRHLQGLANVTTPQQAADWIGQGVQLGEFSMADAQRVMAGLQSGQIPLDQWKQRAQQGGMTLQQQAQQRMQEMEFGLKKDQFGETQRHNKASEGLTARGQDVSATTTRRGQDMVDARTREQLAQNPKAGSHASKVQDANEALQLIDQAEQIIGTATGSGLGNMIDRGAQAVGVSTKGAQAAAQLKAVEGMLVAKMPKMSGPQSDKDVLLYRQMAGQIGDPTIPADTKRAALKAIREIQQRYAGQPAASATGQPAGGAAPTVSNW